MTEDDGYSISLNTAGPRDPRYVLEVAKALAECARVLNHLTRDHGALQYPSEADRLIRVIASAASRLPQLLGQVGAWLGAEQDAGRIRVPEGPFRGLPASAVIEARNCMDEAAGLAERLQEALGAAASVTASLAAPDTGEDGTDG